MVGEGVGGSWRSAVYQVRKVGRISFRMARMQVFIKNVFNVPENVSITRSRSQELFMIATVSEGLI